MIEITSKKDLSEQLNKNSKVLVLFYASWCPYCRNFLQTVDKSLASYGFEHIVHANLDDYDNPLWEDYSVEAVPTLVYFEGGKVSKRLDAESGAGLTEKRCREWLEKFKKA
jgi:thioredoxin 1